MSGIVDISWPLDQTFYNGRIESVHNVTSVFSKTGIQMLKKGKIFYCALLTGYDRGILGWQIKFASKTLVIFIPTGYIV